MLCTIFTIKRKTQEPKNQYPLNYPVDEQQPLEFQKNHHRPLRPLKQHWGNLGPASQPPLPSTSKSHKIKPIFITSCPHGSVESIPAFSQANGHPPNHKNTPRPLTVINHSSLSQPRNLHHRKPYSQTQTTTTTTINTAHCHFLYPFYFH